MGHFLAVDFAPGNVFARGTDCGKVTVEELRSRRVGDFAQDNYPPAILWSDDGGQFDAVLEQQMHLHIAGPPSEQRVRRGVNQDPLGDSRGRATPLGARDTGIQRADGRSHWGGA